MQLSGRRHHTSAVLNRHTESVRLELMRHILSEEHDSCFHHDRSGCRDFDDHRYVVHERNAIEILMQHLKLVGLKSLRLQVERGASDFLSINGGGNVCYSSTCRHDDAASTHVDEVWRLEINGSAVTISFSPMLCIRMSSYLSPCIV